MAPEVPARLAIRCGICTFAWVPAVYKSTRPDLGGKVDGHSEPCPACGTLNELPGWDGGNPIAKTGTPAGGGARPPELTAVLDSFQIDVAPLKGLPGTVRSTELATVAATFVANVDRVIDMHLQVPYLIYVAMAMQRLACQAIQTVKQTVPFDAPADLMVDADSREERERLYQAWAAKEARDPVQYEEFIQALAVYGTVVANLSPDRAVSGYRASLANQLIGLWTAYESFATDLWVQALNLRPSTLGMKALESQSWQKSSSRIPLHESEPDETPARRAGPKPLSYQILKAHKFNLSNKLGTALHQSRKFDFNRADGIQYAYTTVFGDSARGVFSRYNDGVSRLEAIRNLLVHRAGQVDQAFIDRVKWMPDLASLKEGNKLPLPATIAAETMRVILPLGKELLALVDAELAKPEE